MLVTESVTLIYKYNARDSLELYEITAILVPVAHVVKDRVLGLWPREKRKLFFPPCLCLIAKTTYEVHVSCSRLRLEIYFTDNGAILSN